MTVKALCPICNTHLLSFEPKGHRVAFSCETGPCGNFELSSTLIAIMNWSPDRSSPLTIRQIAIISHYLKREQLAERLAYLDSDKYENLLRDNWLPSPPDQLNNLLTFLGHAGDFGTLQRVSNYKLLGEIGAPSIETVSALITELNRRGWADTNGYAEGGVVRLSMDGWVRFDELRRGNATGRTAFMAMPFNRNDLDTTILPVARLASRDCGFDLRRLDDNPRPGNIDARMRLEIKQARFLLVELTFSNNGAYWEAGFAEGLGKPVLYLVRQDHEESVHFDTDHSQRVIWNPEQLDKARAEIAAIVRNGIPDSIMGP